MTKAQRDYSVRIAKDVLKQMAYLKPTNGIYVQFKRSMIDKHLTNADVGKQLQSVLPKIRKNCEVCGIGACFISHIKLSDGFKIKRDLVLGYEPGYIGFDKFRTTLNKRMGISNVALIECAFEMDMDRSYGAVDSKACEDAEKFGKKYRAPRTRLKAIMQNIIKNKGEFKP